jgi:uncharacterized phage infection (PIP) family protein YhgE
MCRQEGMNFETAKKEDWRKTEMKKKILILVIIAIAAVLLGYFVSLYAMKGL